MGRITTDTCLFGDQNDVFYEMGFFHYWPSLIWPNVAYRCSLSPHCMVSAVLIELIVLASLGVRQTCPGVEFIRLMKVWILNMLFLANLCFFDNLLILLGSVKSYSGTGEVISTASWQSTSYNSSEQSSRQLDVGACDGVDVVTRLQSNSETSNNSNSNMRTRSMRISEFTEDMDPVDSVAVNSNNSASQKRGARQITMWKTGGVVESKATQSASRRIASIFGELFCFCGCEASGKPGVCYNA